MSEDFALTIPTKGGPLTIAAVRAGSASTWAAQCIQWAGGEFVDEWTVSHIQSGLQLLSVLRVLERGEAVALAEYLDRVAAGFVIGMTESGALDPGPEVFRLVAAALLDYSGNVVDDDYPELLLQHAGRA